MAKNLRNPEDEKAVEDKETEFAQNGFKSLGIMVSDPCKNQDLVLKTKEFNFCGIITLSDPARDDSKDTVTKAHAMGVAVKMITGDDKKIAKYILKEIGLKDNVIYGKDFSEKGNDDANKSTSEHQR